MYFKLNKKQMSNTFIQSKHVKDVKNSNLFT